MIDTVRTNRRYLLGTEGRCNHSKLAHLVERAGILVLTLSCHLYEVQHASGEPRRRVALGPDHSEHDMAAL